MNRRDDLIEQLSTDLEPVRPAPAADLISVAWLLVSAVYVVLLTHLWGPIRPNALHQLATEPRFFAETALGVVAIVLVALAAFRAAVPGALSSGLRRLAFALLVLWLASYVVGLYSPALEPSMLGKRPHCLWETLVYALPPALVGIYLVRRFYPLTPVRTAALVGLVSGMIPALYMQLACMYAPSHILLFHILPGSLMALAAAAVAWRLPAGDRR
jgi:hypothetical protein